MGQGFRLMIMLPIIMLTRGLAGWGLSFPYRLQVFKDYFLTTTEAIILLHDAKSNH